MSIPYRLLKFFPALVLLAALILNGCAGKGTHKPGTSGKRGTQKAYTISGKTYYPLPSAQGFRQVGYASWYGPGFHGRKTANGERYNMHGMTAAHRILPMNTWVRVRNLSNGREVVVRVNDRGPFVKNRIIDLSYTAAKKLGIVGPGTARVELVALGESRIKGDRSSGLKRVPNLTTGDFYVQVGAFTVPHNAYALRDKLSIRYKTVKVRKYEADNGTFYRVQVFAAHNYEAARAVRAQFERNGFSQAFVVRW
jgi:rare lipoprotein A